MTGHSERPSSMFESLMRGEREAPPTPRDADIEVTELRAALKAWNAVHQFTPGQVIRYKRLLAPLNLPRIVPTGLFIVMEAYDDEDAAERSRWDAHAGMRRDLRVGCFDSDGEFQMSYTDSRLYELAPREVLT
jgi:hypothetical protein